MKKPHSMFNRRGFIKRGALFLPAIFLPKFGDNPVVVELFNRDGSEVFHLPRSGLQAASTIKSRTFSSVVDNRIKLNNSNFARLWSTDVGTTWTTIRVGCRISMEDTGAALTGTPRFAYGICSGTSNIYMDASTTHWLGALSCNATWGRTAGPPAYYDGGSASSFLASKRISTTLTTGSSLASGNTYIVDCTTANRGVFFLDFTKGSPNFTLQLFKHYNTAVDISLANYLSQLVVASPTLAEHFQYSSVTIAIDEATNGYFNAVNIGWDRTTPAIELSDLAVVKLA